jgi:hypothetical protein
LPAADDPPLPDAWGSEALHAGNEPAQTAAQPIEHQFRRKRFKLTGRLLLAAESPRGGPSRGGIFSRDHFPGRQPCPSWRSHQAAAGTGNFSPLTRGPVPGAQGGKRMSHSCALMAPIAKGFVSARAALVPVAHPTEPTTRSTSCCLPAEAASVRWLPGPSVRRRSSGSAIRCAARASAFRRRETVAAAALVWVPLEACPAHVFGALLEVVEPRLRARLAGITVVTHLGYPLARRCPGVGGGGPGDRTRIGGFGPLGGGVRLTTLGDTQPEDQSDQRRNQSKSTGHGVSLHGSWRAGAGPARTRRGQPGTAGAPARRHRASRRSRGHSW